MRLWKFAILLGGVAGIVGFFLPFMSYHSSDGQISGSVSAYQVAHGIADAGEILHDADKLAPRAETERVAKEFDAQIGPYRSAMFGLFGPAAALALVGGLAIARRKLGRLGGLFACLLGLASAGIWFLFYTVSHEHHDAEASLGIGVHMLLVAGLAGSLAGLGALVAPDRG